MRKVNIAVKKINIEYNVIFIEYKTLRRFARRFWSNY